MFLLYWAAVLLTSQQVLQVPAQQRLVQEGCFGSPRWAWVEQSQVITPSQDLGKAAFGRQPTADIVSTPQTSISYRSRQETGQDGRCKKRIILTFCVLLF